MGCSTRNCLNMNVIVQETKTVSGKRILPMKAEVEECFKSIIRDRTRAVNDDNVIQLEQTVDGYSGFLFIDDNGLHLVAMHWEHRLSHMVNRYNQIYKVQMPKITPHVCRHTYCSNMARKGMNPKTLQYLMGHSDISVTLNVYTHLGLQDAVEEMTRLQDLERAREEQERMDGFGLLYYGLSGIIRRLLSIYPKNLWYQVYPLQTH